MRFTVEEFNTMVNELLYSNPVSFDMLCKIADKTLKPSVINWCYSEECLKGRGFEEDIMQEIYLRLIKTTVDYFLLRDGIEEPFNNDPEGFEDWMFRVADNLKRGFANKIRNRDFKTEDIDSQPMHNIADEGVFDEQENIERLKQAFSIVLSADANIYKVLTWIAQFVVMLENDVTKIESNGLIIDEFENKTLYDMYNLILSASKGIEWLEISEEQHNRILNALHQKRSGDISYGDTKYKEFFMKHNGKVSGKKSISDWNNRTNNIIKKSVSEKGRGRNETLDC